MVIWYVGYFRYVIRHKIHIDSSKYDFWSILIPFNVLPLSCKMNYFNWNLKKWFNNSLVHSAKCAPLKIDFGKLNITFGVIMKLAIWEYIQLENSENIKSGGMFLFSKWSKFRLIRWIGQNESYMSKDLMKASLTQTLNIL